MRLTYTFTCKILILHKTKFIMKTIVSKLLSASFALLIILAMVISPLTISAQDNNEAAQDNSSSFNDSVQFDDMEPIFAEVSDEEDEVVADSSEEGGSSMMLYAGIAVVLLVVLIALKKMGKKKS